MSVFWNGFKPLREAEHRDILFGAAVSWRSSKFKPLREAEHRDMAWRPIRWSAPIWFKPLREAESIATTIRAWL